MFGHMIVKAIKELPDGWSPRSGIVQRRENLGFSTSDRRLLVKQSIKDPHAAHLLTSNPNALRLLYEINRAAITHRSVVNVLEAIFHTALGYIGGASGSLLYFSDEGDLEGGFMAYRWGHKVFQYIDEENTQVLHESRPNKQGHVLKDLLRRTLFFPPGTAVVRRECLDRVGPFDETCPAAADTDMWIRIARAGYAFGYVDQPLFQYRVVKDSMSSRTASQARDEFARLDKFFTDPGLPDDIKALEAEAYAALHYEFGAKCYHAGEIELGQDHLRAAISSCPSLASDEEWLLEWIAGYALGPHVDEPRRLIDLIFDHLPPEATTLRSLRRRAHGRYHAAAAFSAYQTDQPKEIRSHIWPALSGDPSIIRNRGFVRIAVRSLLG